MIPLAREKDAELPFKAHEGDAGWDLPLKGVITLQPYENRLIKIGLHIKLPIMTVGMIFPRSSVSRAGVQIFPGVIDANYTGEIGVQAMNLNDEPVTFAKGHRIAQLVILQLGVNFKERFSEKSLREFLRSYSTDRGTDGFGSSGK